MWKTDCTATRKLPFASIYLGPKIVFKIKYQCEEPKKIAGIGIFSLSVPLS